MQYVGAGLCHQRDDAPSRLPVFSRDAVRHHLEFLDSFKRVGDRGSGVDVVVIVSPVDQHQSASTVSTHIEVRVRRRSARHADPRRFLAGARRELDQCAKAAIQHRQLLNFLILKIRRRGCLSCL